MPKKRPEWANPQVFFSCFDDKKQMKTHFEILLSQFIYFFIFIFPPKNKFAKNGKFSWKKKNSISPIAGTTRTRSLCMCTDDDKTMKIFTLIDANYVACRSLVVLSLSLSFAFTVKFLLPRRHCRHCWRSKWRCRWEMTLNSRLTSLGGCSHAVVVKRESKKKKSKLIASHLFNCIHYFWVEKNTIFLRDRNSFTKKIKRKREKIDDWMQHLRCCSERRWFRFVFLYSFFAHWRTEKNEK